MEFINQVHKSLKLYFNQFLEKIIIFFPIFTLSKKKYNMLINFFFCEISLHFYKKLISNEILNPR